MALKVTNAVLAEKIENLKEYLVERNNLQDKRIHLQEEKTEKNTVAIAGIKGAALAISGCVSLIISIAGIWWSMFKAKVL